MMTFFLNYFTTVFIRFYGVSHAYSDPSSIHEISSKTINDEVTEDIFDMSNVRIVK